MIALALGPGSAVLIWGAFISSFARVGRRGVATGSLPLPSGTRRRVFEHDAACVEVFADSIGFGKVARRAGGAARLYELLDFVHRHRRPVVFGAAQRQNAE